MSHQIEITLIKAALKILRPLVRVLIRNGIACGQLEETVRKAYVDEAFTLAEQSGKATVSSVSAQTGLSRKEVKRLREQTDTQSNSNDQKYNRAIRVISGWMNDPRFVSGQGIPRPLIMDEGEASFAQLVKDYSGDIPTRAMFDLLEQSGCVERLDNRVYLISHAYVPGNDSEELINILGNDTSELINTIQHNMVCAEHDKRFQRKVSTRLLATQHLPEFQTYARKRSQSLLEELDSWLTQHEVQSEHDDAQYVSLGIYFYQNDPEMDGGK